MRHLICCDANIWWAWLHVCWLWHIAHVKDSIAFTFLHRDVCTSMPDKMLYYYHLMPSWATQEWLRGTWYNNCTEMMCILRHVCGHCRCLKAPERTLELGLLCVWQWLVGLAVGIIKQALARHRISGLFVPHATLLYQQPSQVGFGLCLLCLSALYAVVGVVLWW